MSIDIVRPMRPLRVRPDAAARVASPPYDVLDSEEARALAGDNGDSFLHVSKPEIDFPTGADAHSSEVYTRGRANLDRLVEDGLLCRDEADSVYLYRLTMDAHVQTGVVLAAAVDAYLGGRIKQHEHTKADKVEDRARNAAALDAHTGTLFLTYRAEPDLDDRIVVLTEPEPLIRVDAEDGIRHELWRVSDPDSVGHIVGAFNAMPAVYIADGHHRSAAAAKLAEWRRAQGDDSADWFLAALFPHDQVQILPYNRIVRTLGAGDAAALLSALHSAFEVEASAAPVQPRGPGEFGLYLPGAWYRLSIRPEFIPDDPLGGLDINLLERHCLAPLLGIEDQRTDARIDFVGGIRGVEELERRVDSGDARVAFSFFATSLADLLAVADAGEVMPPKSTWFEPKLRDGLLVLPLG